ncbi:MAG: 4Fe-4S binding protein, partial [Anaerolineae bacterium]|nr:4Fe-4S binding protein [Anaerolineae bacterium]
MLEISHPVCVTGGKVDNHCWVPQIDLSRCTACAECIARCPTGALGFREGKPAVIRPDACCYSGICEAICPTGAIQLPYQVRFGPAARPSPNHD